MCGPAAGLIAAVGSQVVGFMAQQQDFENKKAAWEQNYTNSLAAGREEQQAITNRAIEEQEANAQKMHLSLLEEGEKKAEAQVSAAEAGVAGISVQSIITDLGRKASYNRVTLDRNYKITAAQLTREMEGTNTRTLNRINSVERPTPPNPLGLAFGILGAGAQYAGQM